MAKKGEGRTFCVSVVGLSGTEREKGILGSGKSCLCNRFVRTHADKYFVDHISLLSQSDFSGRVVNNDHYLYWGSIAKSTEEGLDYNLHVIEQTEFIDDASFQPFKAGKTEPYIKRCCATKLTSAEKLMYVCKNQLGLEKEFEQRLMPDGRFFVDGFVCVFDVSVVQNRNMDRMVDFTIAILNNILKTKKPVVLVTTKVDEGADILMREAERLVARKEFKGTIPIVETSAHEGVNVDAAFLLLAQMMDTKYKGHRLRVLPFQEASRLKKEAESVVREGFRILLRSQVGDFRATWDMCVKKFEQFSEFLRYCEVFGEENARLFFRRHINKLKEDCVSRKLQGYLDLLPQVFLEFYPELDSIVTTNWDVIRDQIRDHPDFDRYFVDAPLDDSVLIETTDIRIPFDLLELTEANTVFRNHMNALQADQRRLDMKEEFKRVLEENGFITPGKTLSEVRVLLLGRDCFEALSPADAQEIYKWHQFEITERAKINFQELLLEHADLFYNFRSLCQQSPTGTSGISTTGSGGSSSVTHDDIRREIVEVLQEDSRYKALDRLEQQREVMLFRHLGFVHSPIREHCPAFPNCIDSLVEASLRSRLKNSRSSSWANGPGKPTVAKSTGSLTDQNTTWGLSSPWNSGEQSDEDPYHLNLAVLGSAGLADELASSIRGQCTDDLYELDGETFSLDYKLIHGDVSLSQNAIRTPDFNPHGIICAYSSAATLEYVRASVEQTLLSNLEASTGSAFNSCLPIVILFAGDPALPEDQRLLLLEEGHSLAQSLQCDLVDVDCEAPIPGRRVHTELVNEGLRALCGAIRDQRKSAAVAMLGQGVLGAASQSAGGPDPVSPDAKSQTASGYQTLSGVIQPDIRVILCMLCGDPYSVDTVLAPLLDPSPLGSPLGPVPLSAVRSERSVVIELPLGDSKRTVEVTFSSYHGAGVFKDELVHGFILVYSTKRRASLSTMNAFSSNVAGMPIQIVGITDSGAGGNPTYQTIEFNHALIAQGNAIADRLQAHFMTSTPSCQQETAYYIPFFKEVWEKKPEIEQALKQMAERGGLGIGYHFTMGGADTGDDVEGIDSGEGTMERSDRIKKSSFPRLKNMPHLRHVASFPFQQSHHGHHSHYQHRAGSADGSVGSESIYERLPAGEVSPGDELDETGSPYMASDDSEVDVGIGGARVSSPTRENGGEHLVKPSQIKGRRRAQAWVDDSAFQFKVSHTDEFLTSDPSGRAEAAKRSQTLGRRSKLSPGTAAAKAAAAVKGVQKAQGTQTLKQQPGRINLERYTEVVDTIEKLSLADGAKGMKAGGPLGSHDAYDVARGDQQRRKDKVYTGYEGKFSYLPQPDQKLPAQSKSASKQTRYRHHKEKNPPGRTGSCSPSDEESEPRGEETFFAGRARYRSKKRSSFKSKKMPREVAIPAPPASFVPGSQLIAKNSAKQKPVDEPEANGEAVPVVSKKSEDKKKEKPPKPTKEEEKRRKEEEKQRKQEEKKKKKSSGGGSSPPSLLSRRGMTSSNGKTVEDLAQSPDNPIPLFLEKCIRYIEGSGLDSEGIYRVPGNRAQVDALFLKFDQDGDFRLDELDIPMNAVATALKDFVSKRLPPLFGPDMMEKLAREAELNDSSLRLFSLQLLMKKLPPNNFAIVKFIFQHFVRVAEKSKENSMDSRNLAICWWPTLLPLEFTDMGLFERTRPHLEQAVQTMIDQFPFIFCGEEDVLRV